MSESPFLTIIQCAQRAHVGRSTIKAWIRAGMPVLKLGPRQTRIDVESFDAWVRDLGIGTFTTDSGRHSTVGTLTGTSLSPEGSGVISKKNAVFRNE